MGTTFPPSASGAASLIRFLLPTVMSAFVHALSVAAEDLRDVDKNAAQSIETAAGVMANLNAKLLFVFDNITDLGTVTGSKGGNAALGSLLSLLSSAGWINDQST